MSAVRFKNFKCKDVFMIPSSSQFSMYMCANAKTYERIVVLCKNYV